MVQLTPRARPMLPSFGNPSQAFYAGFRDAAKGNMLSLPFLGLEVGTAQRGEMLATATGRVAGLCTYPVLSAAFAAGLAMIPGVNVAAAGFIASFMAMYPNAKLEDGIGRQVRWLTSAARRIRHLEFGGVYKDSQFAQQQRLRAVQEMNASLIPSRRMLGQEAAIMHR